MTDIDKTVVQKPVAQSPTDDKSVADVTPVAVESVEEPKAEATDDGVMSAGTDQQGRQLYSVKCANCGKQTEVPFKPSGDRPVYCRDCYLQKKGA